MRRRLLASMLGIAGVCVLMLGVPLALLARHQVWTSARDRVREQAAAVATGIEDQLDSGRTLDLRHFQSLMPSRRIIVKPPHGPAVAAGQRLDGKLLQATVVASDARVTVQSSQGPTITRAREVTLVVVGLSLLAAIVAGSWDVHGGPADQRRTRDRPRLRSARAERAPRRRLCGAAARILE